MEYQNSLPYYQQMWNTSRNQQLNMKNQLKVLQMRCSLKSKKQQCQKSLSRKIATIRHNYSNEKKALKNEISYLKNLQNTRLDETIQSIRSLDEQTKISMFQNRVQRQRVGRKVREKSLNRDQQIRDEIISDLRLKRKNRNHIYLSERTEIMNRKEKMMAKLQQFQREKLDQKKKYIKDKMKIDKRVEMILKERKKYMNRMNHKKNLVEKTSTNKSLRSFIF